MAFEAAKGTSDKEIEDYLHKTVGDFRPDWQSLYFDLVGAGELTGLGTGIARIAKPLAVKQLSRGLKEYLGEAKDPAIKELLTRQVGSVFRKLTRSIRRTPQELLDPLESVHLRTVKGAQGHVSIPEKSLSISPGIDPEKLYEILGHELIHVEDLKPFWKAGKKTLPQSVTTQLEERAYQGMGDIGTLLKRGKLAFEDFATLVNQDLDAVVKDLGGESFDLFSKSSKDLVEETLNLPMDKGFSKEAFALGREVHAGEISRSELDAARKAYKAHPDYNPMKGQYLNEAAEFADILGGKTKGLEGKIDFLKKINQLPKDFGTEKLSGTVSSIIKDLGFDPTDVKQITQKDLVKYTERYGIPNAVDIGEGPFGKKSGRLFVDDTAGGKPIAYLPPEDLPF